MVKIDLCIEPFYPGVKTIQKIKNVNSIGFEAIEFWFWDHEFNGKDLIPGKKDIKEISLICKDLNVTVTDLVVNSPDGSIGGSLTRAEDRNGYLERLKETIEIAHILNVRKLITCSGNMVANKTFGEQFDNVVRSLTDASEIAYREGITLVLEALNSHVDHPGYFLTSSSTGFDIVKQVNNPALKLLFDIYHMQIMEGNLIASIRENIALIGHFHSAGVPGRNEIYSGEINYSSILQAIDQSSYEEYFGLEYWPVENEEISLSKTLEYLSSFKK